MIWWLSGHVANVEEWWCLPPLSKSLRRDSLISGVFCVVLSHWPPRNAGFGKFIKNHHGWYPSQASLYMTNLTNPKQCTIFPWKIPSKITTFKLYCLIPPQKIGPQKNLGKLQKWFLNLIFLSILEHATKNQPHFSRFTTNAVWLVAMPGQDDVSPDQLEHPPGASLNLQSDDRYHSNLGFRRSPRGG